ncbi:MAG: chromate efflux transporter [Planctomycetes bacterium]|nr:chromate efflux transporter [Planctomycetota bacterium]
MSSDERTSRRELALLFLRLGFTTFGGPAAHIAMMEDEVVTRRGWLSREEFIDLLGATKLIPGFNSTEMAIHIGRARAGLPGLLVAGCCFIAPAVFIVAVAAWAYVQYGSLPQAEALLYGVKPVVSAIVLQALLRLGLGALKTPLLVLASLAAAALALAGTDELIVLFGIGGAAAIAGLLKGGRPGANLLLAGAFPPIPSALGIGAAAGASAYSQSVLFLVFLEVGSVLFGSGYVLMAFLRRDLVERLGWLSEAQLLDAVAVGQVTLGPVFSTATFIGYILDGPSGAALATAGIFLPAFVFVAASAPLIPRLRRSRFFGAALDGVNAASLALMAVVTWQLGRASLVDGATIILFVASAILLIAFRANSTWLILGAGAAGL